jgi:hypothetical protein
MEGSTAAHNERASIQELMYYQLSEAVITPALAEARLRVFRALVVAGPEGLTPSALAEQLERAEFHVLSLKDAMPTWSPRSGRAETCSIARPSRDERSVGISHRELLPGRGLYR